MAKKTRLDRAGHEDWAKPLVANDTGYALMAEDFAARHGLTDRLTILALQARDSSNKLRAELHRRYVSQGLHEKDHTSPYYPEEVVNGVAGESEVGVQGLPGSGDEHRPERPDAGQCQGASQPDGGPGGDAPAAAGVPASEVRGRKRGLNVRVSAMVPSGHVGWEEEDTVAGKPVKLMRTAKISVVDFSKLPKELVVNHYSQSELLDAFASYQATWN